VHPEHVNALLRWWRNLWRRPAAPGRGLPGARSAARGGAPTILAGDDASRVAPRHHYTAPSRDDDPQREARLGAVLQALSAGPLSVDELGARVGAHDWGPGRLDAVVAHGVAAGVLVENGDEVRARYAD
jgi:hypothetical protein